MKNLLVVILLIGISLRPYSQSAPQDTLYLDEYLTIVTNQHPVMIQSELLLQNADANQLMSKGGFDPKIDGGFDNKHFDDKNYFSLVGSKLKVPTWFGVEIAAGYDYSNGLYTDNSEFLPERGLWNAGISLPLGKGLVIDERRAALRRADIFTDATLQERTLMINDLLFDALIAYLDWQVSAQDLAIATDGVNLANQRLQGMRLSYINGDKPAIDTLEAYISFQDRTNDLLKAEQRLQETRINLNNFLWQRGVIPLELASDIAPESINIDLYDDVLSPIVIAQSEFINSHPELLLFDYKLADLDIDRRLAVEDLKPDLRLGYSPLAAVPEVALISPVDFSNYKINASLYYPLLLRKERGKLKMIKIKQESTSIDQALKQQQIKTKLDAYNNNISQSYDQYVLLSDMVKNYNAMLIAENRIFEIGESSIFLINSREIKYLESRYKQLSAAQKVIFNRLTYLYIIAQMQEVVVK